MRHHLFACAALLLAACKPGGEEPITARPEITRFEVSPKNVAVGESVTYRWQVEGATSCQLDVNSDGSAEYTPGCDAGSQVHTFTQPGNFPATLKADAAQGQNTVQTSSSVTVSDEGSGLADTFSRLAWSPIADSPVDRHEAFGGFAADSKLYVFGGYSNIRENRFRPTREVHAYDPKTNAWEQRADMPEGVSHAGVAVDGTAIYYAGGYPATSTSFGQTFSTTKVWKYDTVSDTYTPLPDLPDRYGGGALALVNNVLHFYGGSTKNRSDSNNHWTLPLDGADTWSPAAGLPVPRNHLGSAVIDGKIYAVGGQSGQDAAATYRAAVHRYDPATDSWTEVASLPQALSHNNGSTFDMGGRIIVLGGEPAYGRSVDLAFAYDPETDTWQELTSMPMAKNAGVGGHADGALYHVTGSTSEDAFKGVPLP